MTYYRNYHSLDEIFSSYLKDLVESYRQDVATWPDSSVIVILDRDLVFSSWIRACTIQSLEKKLEFFVDMTDHLLYDFYLIM